MALSYVPVSSSGIALLTVTGLFTFFAAVAVGLRVQCARFINRAFRAHDYLIFAGLVLSLGNLAVAYCGTLYGGMGHALADIPLTSMPTLSKVLYASCFTWVSSSTAVKASVLFLYLDIFSAHRTLTKVIYVNLAIILIYFIGYSSFHLALCRPINHLWHPERPGACRDFTSPQIATAAVNAVLDLAIVVLPVSVLVRLQLSEAKKWRIISLFTLGILICLVNIARVVTTTLSRSTNFSTAQVAPAILASLEVTLGIVIACLPTINPMLEGNFRRLRKTKGYQYHHQGLGTDDSTLAASQQSWTKGSGNTSSDRGSAAFEIYGVSHSNSTIVQSVQEAKGLAGHADRHGKSGGQIVVTRDVVVQEHSVSSREEA